MRACHSGELAMLVTAQTATACEGGGGGGEVLFHSPRPPDHMYTHTHMQVSFLCVAVGLLATAPKSICVCVVRLLCVRVQQTIDTFSRSAPPRWLLQGLHDQQATGSGRGGPAV